MQFRSKRVRTTMRYRAIRPISATAGGASLYDESRRNKILAKADLAEVDRVLHRDDWNDYRILAIGKRIQLWINGQQTVDYTEPDEQIVQHGLIGLQIHGGPPSEAWYKEIVIEEK